MFLEIKMLVLVISLICLLVGGLIFTTWMVIKQAKTISGAKEEIKSSGSGDGTSSPSPSLVGGGTPSSNPNPAGGGTSSISDVNAQFDGFPFIEKSIIIGNATQDDIYVFFDPTKPFYEEGKTIADSDIWWVGDEATSTQCTNVTDKQLTSCPGQAALSNAWKNSDAILFRYNATTKSWTKDSFDDNFPNRFSLKAGEYMAIQLPLSNNGLPCTCSGTNNPESCNNSKGACGTNGCTGSGIWFVKQNANLVTDGANFYRPPPATRVEFNYDITSSNVYFNLSAVDGLNANIYVDYTGANSSTTYCDKGESVECPFPINEVVVPTDWNYNACLSPVKYSDPSTVNDTNTEVVSVYNAVNDSVSTCGGVNCAGCGTADSTNICNCRKWWQSNNEALKWKNFVQQNNNCNIYSWAYDELILSDPACSTCPNCDSAANPITPLLNFPITSGGSLRIKIIKVF